MTTASYEYKFAPYSDDEDNSSNNYYDTSIHKSVYGFSSSRKAVPVLNNSVEVNNYIDEVESSNVHTEKPLTSPLFDKSQRDWNEDFQKILDQFSKQQTHEETHFDLNVYQQQLVEKQEIATKLRELCAAFGAEATSAAQVIIQENELPIWNKSIPPRDLGGIAGGSKYVWKNMVLKFAIDNDSMIYGGNDELIMKVANQELKGLQTLIECKIAGLHFPLMALIDYRGYRVIASSLLPIDSRTLVYGSPDGGVTVYNRNEQAVQKIAQAAAILNLKKHHLNGTEFYGPVDMEVHLAKDGRLYVIDTSRLFPPTLPVANNLMKKAGQLLAYHFRPVIVKKYKHPLSSDALSGFGKDSREIDESEITEATKTLIKEIIPAFAKQLSADTSLRKYAEHSLTTICSKFHVYGINLRYMGVVRRLVTTRIIKDLLLILMIARTAKSLLNQELRAACNPMGKETAKLSDDMKQNATGSSRPCGRSGERTVVDPDKYFKKAVAAMLSNIVSKTDDEVAAWAARLNKKISLSSSAESHQEKGKLFWSKFIQEAIVLKYVDGLTEEEKTMDLRTVFHFSESDSSWRIALALYFSKLVGLYQAFPNQLFVTADLIKKLEPKTKLLDIAYKDLGIAQVAHAELIFGSGKCASLILQAEKTLELAYKIKSDDEEINKAIALNTVLLGKLGFLDAGKIAHAENLCDDCIKQSNDCHAQLLKACLQLQRTLTTAKRKSTSPDSLLEPLLKQLESLKHNNPLLIVRENQAKIFFAKASLHNISTANLQTNLDLLTRIDSILKSVNQQYLFPHNLEELVLLRSKTLLFQHEYYASQKGTLLTKSQQTILDCWEQTFKEAIQMLHDFCTQHPHQYNLIEQWELALKMVDEQDTILGDFVKTQKTDFQKFVEQLKKDLWPEQDTISVTITNIASGETMKRAMEISIQTTCKGDTIPFLNNLKFRLHPTCYPHTLALSEAPFMLSTTANGVSTGALDLEFCKCFVADGWNVSLEWQISPEKDSSKTVYELNLASKTAKQTRVTS